MNILILKEATGSFAPILILLEATDSFALAVTFYSILACNFHIRRQIPPVLIVLNAH